MSILAPVQNLIYVFIGIGIGCSKIAFETRVKRRNDICDSNTIPPSPPPLPPQVLKPVHKPIGYIDDWSKNGDNEDNLIPYYSNTENIAKYKDIINKYMYILFYTREGKRQFDFRRCGGAILRLIDGINYRDEGENYMLKHLERLKHTNKRDYDFLLQLYNYSKEFEEETKELIEKIKLENTLFNT
jgi:hypothetical protein